jgi:hypothetical protein
MLGLENLRSDLNIMESDAIKWRNLNVVNSKFNSLKQIWKQADKELKQTLKKDKGI